MSSRMRHIKIPIGISYVQGFSPWYQAISKNFSYGEAYVIEITM